MRLASAGPARNAAGACHGSGQRGEPRWIWRRCRTIYRVELDRRFQVRKPFIIAAAAFAAFSLAAYSPAMAETASPQQIQGMIASGQEQTALSELHGIVEAHPHSGVAWYLTAEAQDASGNEAAARSALAKAEHYSPGLPFANPHEVAALQAHVNGGAVAPARHHSVIGPFLFVIVGLIVLFLLLRLFLRPRRAMMQRNYPAPYGYGQQGGPPVYPPYGPHPGGFGSGLGSSLMGGLAAGAGFAAGERVIDDVFGNRAAPMGENFQQDQNFGNGGIGGQDDGLMGNPGWDDGSGQDDDFDPGNSW